MDIVLERMEYATMQAGSTANEYNECNKSGPRVFRVSLPLKQNQYKETIDKKIGFSHHFFFIGQSIHQNKTWICCRRNVLEQHRSNGLDYMGPIKPSLAICVFSVFVLVYFSLWKGVRSAGKVVWVTALAPYVVLFFLLIRGVTLPGAADGIRYYLTPQWHKLKNSKVWEKCTTSKTPKTTSYINIDY